MSAPVPAPVSDSASITSGGQFLALLLRFLVGYCVMFACLLLLLRRPAWTLSSVDIVFWLALGMAVVMLRLTSVDGWRRAAILHVAVGGGLWALCQSFHAIP